MPLQSDLPPARYHPATPSLLDHLTTDGPWLAMAERFAARHPRRHDRIAAYERLVDSGEHLRIGEQVLAGCYCPAPPVEGRLNKADGRKKRVFQYPPAEELLFRAVNLLIQPAAAEVASPWCRSFLPGGGARSSFRSLLDDPCVDGKSALRLDIRDYFNSIDVADLLERVGPALGDPVLERLLALALCDARVERGGRLVDGGRKGVMAGTPLAPLLATLYLSDLDVEVAATATYARYSDDFAVLADPKEVRCVEALLRRRLAERGLRINEAKSSVAAPGEPWDFLGFRYHQRRIGLAPITERKAKAKATRLARGLCRWRERTGAPAARTVSAFFRRTNARLYGTSELGEFSWSRWFLPMLNDAGRLSALDEHVQREVRYAATGLRTARAQKRLPYSCLADGGHLPLVAAYWAMQHGPDSYDDLIRQRTGLGSG